MADRGYGWKLERYRPRRDVGAVCEFSEAQIVLTHRSVDMAEPRPRLEQVGLVVPRRSCTMEYSVEPNDSKPT